MTASEFADAIGRKTLADTFGVGLTAVSNAVVRGRFPSSWYVASCTLASEAGIQCPPDLFGQKQVASQTVDKPTPNKTCNIHKTEAH